MGRTVECFSRPENLRCSGLSHIQGVIVILPPAVQLLTALFLATSIGRRKLRNSLIFIEAFATFALAAGDFVLHEAARDSSPSFLDTFQVADRAIGALSSIPPFSYTLFLLLYLNASVLPFVNPLYSNIYRYSFAILIPLIIVFNELGGLLSLDYGVVGGTIAQGFTDVNAQMSSHTFTVVTLATLLVIQLGAGISCGILTYHMDRIEKLGDGIPGTYPSAMMWVTAGTAVGAVEALLAFAGANFVTVLVRRVLVVVSRLFVIIALTKQAYESLIPPLGTGSLPLENKTNLRSKISNPRYSTFTHFHNRFLDRTRSLYDIGPSDNNAMLGRGPRRVTVTYDRVNPPTLNVRFSTISLPTVDRALATVRKPSIKSNIQSMRANAGLYRYRPEYFPEDSPRNSLRGRGAINIAPGSLEPRPTTISSTPSSAMTELGHATLYSTKSKASSLGLSVFDESIELATVRGLAVQFPNTPMAVARSAIREHAGYHTTGSTAWPYPWDQSSQSVSGGQSTTGHRVSWIRARDIPIDMDMGESQLVSLATSTWASRHPDWAAESTDYSVTMSSTPDANGVDRQLNQFDVRRDSTADLASYQVFRDRFGEQREERSRSHDPSVMLTPPLQSRWSNTGSTTSIRASLTASPSALLRTESRPAGTTDFSEDEDISHPRAILLEIDSRRTTPSAVELPNQPSPLASEQAYTIGLAVTRD